MTTERAVRYARLNTKLLIRLIRSLDRLTTRMETLMSDQSQLDTDVAALTGVFGDIEAEIAALKAQPAAVSLDFTKLDALVARAKGDDPGAPAAPVPPVAPPADPGTAAPAVPAPADGSGAVTQPPAADTTVSVT